ncbi:MAG: LamG-like jellyroll fold domain-containing protein [Kiritimatiellales bacterium]
MKRILTTVFLSAALGCVPVFGETAAYWTFDSYAVSSSVQTVTGEVGSVAIVNGTSGSGYRDFQFVDGYDGGTALYFTTLVNGGALGYNGSSTPVSTIELSTFTLEAYIKPAAVPTTDYATLIRVAEALPSTNPARVTYELRLQQTVNGLCLGLMFTDDDGNQELHLMEHTALATGAWAYVAAVCDAASRTLTLQVDGRAQHFSIQSVPTTALVTRSLCVGLTRTDGDQYHNPYTGSIDKIRISNTALSSQDRFVSERTLRLLMLSMQSVIGIAD